MARWLRGGKTGTDTRYGDGDEGAADKDLLRPNINVMSSSSIEFGCLAISQSLRLKFAFVPEAREKIRRRLINFGLSGLMS